MARPEDGVDLDIHGVTGVLETNDHNVEFFGRIVETAADEAVLPPLLGALAYYEQFIPMIRDCSPLLLELGEDDPGIIVTQSVHKQQAGFSQASQIHKKDAHIAGQARQVNHDRFNELRRSWLRRRDPTTTGA